MNTFKRLAITLVVFGMVASGSNAFARMGKGMGQNGDAPGQGMRMGMMGHGMGMGMGMGNLTPDELKLFQAEKAALIKETETLRQRLYQKNLELRSELAKAKADPKKAGAIQKDISDIQATLDKKRLNHMLKLNKIKPGLGGMNMGRGMGQRGMGRGMGKMGGNLPPCPMMK